MKFEKMKDFFIFFFIYFLLFDMNAKIIELYNFGKECSDEKYTRLRHFT